MINFEWYRSFIAVYRAGTITGAARARMLTQPAISQHIAALETLSGKKLFQRAPRKMIPTEHGHALYSKLAPSFDDVETFTAAMLDVTSEAVPSLRIGVPFDYFYVSGLDKIKDAPFRFYIGFGDAEHLIDELSQGRYDAVIATKRGDTQRIDYRKIQEEDFCVVSSPNMYLEMPVSHAHARAEIEEILLQQRWISYAAELPIIRRFWQIAFRHRPRIEPVMVVPSLLMIRRAVELGVGISILPRYLCHQSIDRGTLSVVWEPDLNIGNELWLAFPKVNRHRPELEKLFSYLL